jgi:hypothetical protein
MINRVEGGLILLETMDSPFLAVCFPKKAENLARNHSGIKADRSRIDTDIVWTPSRYLSISLPCAMVANTVAQAWPLCYQRLPRGSTLDSRAGCLPHINDRLLSSVSYDYTARLWNLDTNPTA